MVAVQAQHFSFTYPGMDRPVLHDLSFTLEHNHTIGIVGPPGCGKTTLCRALAGFAPGVTGGFTSGNLLVGGQPAQSQPKAERDGCRVAMAFEDYDSQLTELRVLDEVATPLRNRGLWKGEAIRRARELLGQVGLKGDGIENRWVWTLSAGQTQRLAIAATLALEPDLLILDCVIDMLDPVGRAQLVGIIESIARRTTLILVSQDVELLHTFADELLVLVDGRLHRQGAPAVLLRDHELLERADLAAPLPLQAARALGLAKAPLSDDELEPLVERSRTHTSRNAADSRLRPVSYHSDALLRIEDLSYWYQGGLQALDGVNLTVTRGEVHGLSGGDQAGKTTLVRHIAALLRPREGRVIVCGRDTSDASPSMMAPFVGTVMQKPDQQITERNLFEEVGFKLRQLRRMRRLPEGIDADDKAIEQRIRWATEMAGLTAEHLQQDPILLPREFRRLVTIASALTLDPEVLVFDEPLSGLGASGRARFAVLLEQLRLRQKAVLIVEQDIDFLAEQVDSMTFLDRGRVALQGPVSKIFTPANQARLDELHYRLPSTLQMANRFGRSTLSFDRLIGGIKPTKRNGDSNAR